MTWRGTLTALTTVGPAVAALVLVAALMAAPDAGAAPVAAPVTPATAVFTPYPRATAVGDVTGDGVADQVTLGLRGDQQDEKCAVRLAVGLGRGVFAAPTVYALAVRGDRSVVGFQCPDMVVVLTGPVPSADRFVVGFSQFAPASAFNLQFFAFSGTAMIYAGGFDGSNPPNVLGSLDFDGDGWGDIYEQNDNQGLQVYVGRGQHYRLLYGSGPVNDTAQFIDFTHGKGTDILDYYTFFGFQSSGVTVADGLTGSRIDLLAEQFPGSTTTEYQASAVDLDHNTYLDVKVTTVADGTDEPTRYFKNISNAGRFAFVECNAFGRPLQRSTELTAGP